MAEWKYLWSAGSSRKPVLNASGKPVQRTLSKPSKPLEPSERRAELERIGKEGSVHAPVKQAKRPTGRSAQWRRNVSRAPKA